MDEYLGVIAKNTELFSTADPDTLLDSILAYATALGYTEYKLSKDRFKLKRPVLNEKNQKVEIKIEILKVDENKACVEFTKLDGDYLTFIDEFNLIKDYMGELIDASK